MKNDLVARLRAPRPRPGYPYPLPPHPWMMEAADEIERLTAELARWQANWESWKQSTPGQVEAECDRLRAALREAEALFDRSAQMRTLILKGVPYELDLADFTHSGHRRHNLAFICPRCLSSWAFIIDGRADPLHSLFGVPCALCAPTIMHPIPGSLLDRWAGFGGGIDDELLEALPRELLVRELDLHIKAYDNENARSDRPDSMVDYPGKPLSEAAGSV